MYVCSDCFFMKSRFNTQVNLTASACDAQPFMFGVPPEVIEKLFVMCDVKRFQFLKNLTSNDITKRNIENNF